MAKKAEAPLVWDGKSNKYVPARQAVCSRCGKRRYIALRKGNQRKCFECYEEMCKKWGLDPYDASAEGASGPAKEEK